MSTQSLIENPSQSTIQSWGRTESTASMNEPRSESTTSRIYGFALLMQEIPRLDRLFHGRPIICRILQDEAIGHQTDRVAFENAEEEYMDYARVTHARKETELTELVARVHKVLHMNFGENDPARIVSNQYNRASHQKDMKDMRWTIIIIQLSLAANVDMVDFAQESVNEMECFEDAADVCASVMNWLQVLYSDGASSLWQDSHAKAPIRKWREFLTKYPRAHELPPNQLLYHIHAFLARVIHQIALVHRKTATSVMRTVSHVHKESGRRSIINSWNTRKGEAFERALFGIFALIYVIILSDAERVSDLTYKSCDGLRKNLFVFLEASLEIADRANQYFPTFTNYQALLLGLDIQLPSESASIILKLCFTIINIERQEEDVRGIKRLSVEEDDDTEEEARKKYYGGLSIQAEFFFRNPKSHHTMLMACLTAVRDSDHMWPSIMRLTEYLGTVIGKETYSVQTGGKSTQYTYRHHFAPLMVLGRDSNILNNNSSTHHWDVLYAHVDNIFENKLNSRSLETFRHVIYELARVCGNEFGMGVSDYPLRNLEDLTYLTNLADYWEIFFDLDDIWEQKYWLILDTKLPDGIDAVRTPCNPESIPIVWRDRYLLKVIISFNAVKDAWMSASTNKVYHESECDLFHQCTEHILLIFAWTFTWGITIDVNLKGVQSDNKDDAPVNDVGDLDSDASLPERKSYASVAPVMNWCPDVHKQSISVHQSRNVITTLGSMFNERDDLWDSFWDRFLMRLKTYSKNPGKSLFIDVNYIIRATYALSSLYVRFDETQAQFHPLIQHDAVCVDKYDEYPPPSPSLLSTLYPGLIK